MHSYGRTWSQRRHQTEVEFSSESDEEEPHKSQLNSKRGSGSPNTYRDTNTVSNTSLSALDSSPVKTDNESPRNPKKISLESEFHKQKIKKIGKKQQKVDELDAWDDLFGDIDNAIVPEGPQIETSKYKKYHDDELDTDDDLSTDTASEEEKTGAIAKINITSILLSFASSEAVIPLSSQDVDFTKVSLAESFHIQLAVPSLRSKVVKYDITRTYKLELHDDDEELKQIEQKPAQLFMFESLSPSRKKKSNKHIKNTTSFHLNDYKVNEANNNRNEATEFILAGLVFNNVKNLINGNSILILTLVDIANGVSDDFAFEPVVEGLDDLLEKIASCKQENSEYLSWLTSSVMRIYITKSVLQNHELLHYEIKNMDSLFNGLELRYSIPSGILKIMQIQLSKINESKGTNLQIELIRVLKEQMFFTKPTGLALLVSLYWKCKTSTDKLEVLKCIEEYIDCEYEADNMRWFQPMISETLRLLKSQAPSYHTSLVLKLAVLISTRYEALLDDYITDPLIRHVFSFINSQLKESALSDPNTVNSVLFSLGLLLNVIATHKVVLQKLEILSNVMAATKFAANNPKSDIMRHVLGYNVLVLGSLRLVTSFDVDLGFLTSQLTSFREQVDSATALGLTLKIDGVVKGINQLQST